MPTSPSKENWDKEKPSFPILPHQEYELIIEKVEEDKQNKYMAKPDKNGQIPQEDIINVLLEIVAYRDGGSPEDEEGGDARGRKVFFTGRPNSMGWMQDGTPSKTRCFVAYGLRKDIDSDLDWEWEDLVGKTIYAEKCYNFVRFSSYYSINFQECI